MEAGQQDPPAEDANDLQEVIAHIRDNDWFLTDLVRVFAQNGIEFPLTVFVGGAVISGKLIGGKRYFEELGKMLSSGTTNEPEIRDLLVRMVEGNTSIYNRPDDASDESLGPEPGYVHLEGARVFNAGQQPLPTNQGLLWRGKLSSVDGFAFGELRAE